MIYTLESDTLKISVNEVGTELCEIKSMISGKDFMWNADPAIWANYSPVLFPIVGGLKNNTFMYKGHAYELPRHGFIRNNADIKLVARTSDSLTFGLESSDKTRLVYPFDFYFHITYTLSESEVTVGYKVGNTGDDTMLFSLGAHPAFKCPLQADESYDDYYLEFETAETASTWLLQKDGLVSGATRPVLENSNILNLTGHLFDGDALIFKDLKSEKVILKSSKSDATIGVAYKGFPYMGIWAKPGAHFVCIEPWLGIADSADSDQNLEHKEGILRLDKGDIYEAAYQIGISE